MRIVYLEVRNFRGNQISVWHRGCVNCLIGPVTPQKRPSSIAIGAILNPRSYSFADDCDFFDLISKSCCGPVTLAGLPGDFKAEDRSAYTFALEPAARKSRTSPARVWKSALHHRSYDQSLEARWSIHNDRITCMQGPAALYLQRHKRNGHQSLGHMPKTSRGPSLRP